ncbi:DUF1176 domain-containing protein [Devosia sp. YIM 151766]|uniref:DUF1176 domain-containing protein n=1 Tax=Devosia sp. YIM 151766 TaxID=3017325 RepID=UPI00255CD09A|nr:DUF1176 domain-containing protein [Devosia sp. YIM 151766]WIY54369.1 DUF1176 domain-containing protein [Devosia sp. YIM 151766]
MIRPWLWLPLAALSLSPALAQESSLQKQAQKLHALAGGEYCAPVEGGYVPDDAYSEWTFSYQPDWGDDAPEVEVTLIRIFCGAGAYNLQHAYYIQRQYEGLTPLPFAAPSVEAHYAEGDDIDSGLESLAVTGMKADLILVNSEFDPETRTITAHALWRGIGDASSTGIWQFKDGDFVLVRYEVDASYDGEVNPELVYEAP